MERLMWVVLGGAIGAALRLGVNEGVAAVIHRGSEPVASPWPLATLIVNVLGCFLIGVLAPMAGDGRIGIEARYLLIVGLLGAFTTFSAFGWEVVEMMREGRLAAALTVVGLNNLLGLAAVWVGWWLAAPGEAG